MDDLFSAVEGAGDLATWLGSLGTIGAFIVAFWQIRRERLERQRRERREWWERLRAHAHHVSAWIVDGTLTISNTSHHLIHEVDVSLDDQHSWHWDLCEPGTSSRPVDVTTEQLTPVRIDFTDARGQRWQCRSGHPPQPRPHAGASRLGPSAQEPLA